MKRFFKVAISLCMLLFMGVIVSACSLFGGSYKVSEREWCDGLSYSGKRVVSTITTGSDPVNVTKYIDGNNIKIHSLIDGSLNINYFEYDGTAYWSYYLYNNVWQRRQINKNDFEEITETFSDKVFPYEDFIIDNEKQCYYAEDLRTLDSVFDVSIKFKDGKLIEVYYEQAGFSSKNTYSYENFTVTIPTPGTQYDKEAEENGGEQPGQGGEEQPGQGGEESGKTVSASQWGQALNPQVKYKMIQTMNMQGMQTYSTVYVDGNKVKQETTLEGQTFVSYANYDGTKYWNYFKNPDSEEWYKQEVDEDDYYERTSSNLSMFLQYNQFTFNQSTGKYEATNYISDDDVIDYVSVEFLNKKVVGIYISVQGTEVTCVYNYTSNFVINLPQVSPENIFESEEGGEEGDGEELGYEVSESEWADAMMLGSEYEMFVMLYVYEGSNPLDFSVSGTSTTIMVKDNMVRQINTDGEYYFYFDGEIYWHYYKDEQTGDWQRASTVEIAFESAKGNTICSILNFGDFTFNYTTGCYEAENLAYEVMGQQGIYGRVLVRFDQNKKLAEITVELGNEKTEVTFDFESMISITLPDINN